MRSPRIRLPLLALAGLLLAGPALAQGNAASPAAGPPSTATAPPGAPAAPAFPAPQSTKMKTAPDADQDFLIGLRRIGVMAGQVVECSAAADKQAQISQAMDLANQIAIHFGLRAAFNFVGALGYGSGHPFDKAGCSRAIDGWKQIQAKYLNK
jgi:hypothetical protein